MDIAYSPAPLPDGADVVQEFTLFVEEFERSAASLPYPDILVGDEGEPGFEHGGVRVVETYDAAVFDKFAERHVDSVFRQGEVGTRSVRFRLFQRW